MTVSPGWWIDSPPKPRHGHGDVYLLVQADGRWWRNNGFYPGMETLVVESDKAELDIYFTKSGREKWARYQFALADLSQQDIWMRENPDDPYVKLRARAIEQERNIVSLLYTAINAAIIKNESWVRLPGRDQFSSPFRRRSHPQWTTLAALRGDPPVIP